MELLITVKRSEEIEGRTPRTLPATPAILSEIDQVCLATTQPQLERLIPPLRFASFLGTKDNTRRQGKSELAQLWKDMKRDTVSINGRVLKGELGPEAIVGALTRCILAQAS